VGEKIAAKSSGSFVETVSTHDFGVRGVEDDRAYLRRMSYFMLFRLGLLTIFTLLAALSSYIFGERQDPFSERLTWGTLALGYAMTVIFASRLRQIREVRGAFPRKRQLSRLAWGQTIFDILLAAVVVQLSGGADSGFAFLYLIAILGAATMGDRRQTWATAGTCAIIYATMGLLQTTGAILPTSSSGEVSTISQTTLWWAIARTNGAMAMIAFLSAHLNNQLLSSVHQIDSLRLLNENIVRSLTSGLLTIDPEGRVLYANPTALEILGINSSVPDLDCERLLPGVRPHLSNSSGPENRFELLLPRDDGTDLHLGLNCCPLLDNESRFLGHVINFQDVTEIHEMGRRLRRNERLAAIGGLASSVAHEVRNPLAAISGCAELLGRVELGGEDKKLLDIIRRESSRLSTTVHDLLAFTGQKSPEFAVVDLNHCLADIAEAFRSDPAMQEIDLVLELTTTPALARVDPAQFSQVIWNLIRNAAEAMPSGRLRLSSHHDDQLVCIGVHDSGPGIEASKIERIFEPFFSTKATGSGIGLALVHRIVQEHEGTIDVRSTEGHGTAFSIQLPAATIAGDELTSFARRGPDSEDSA